MINKLIIFFIKKLIIFFIKLIFFMVLIFVKILNPVFSIRFGFVDLTRIGAIYNLDWNLSEKKIQNISSFDIFFHNDPKKLANHQWKKMWGKNVCLINIHYVIQSILKNFQKNNFFNNCFIIDTPVNGSNLEKFFAKKSLYLIKKNNNRLNYVLQNTIPNISFTKEEEAYGFKLINKLGIPNDCKFVCIHNRDSAYLDTDNPNPGVDWSYHKFRDFSIKDFKLTIDKLIQRGYFVIRMGAIVKEHLNYSDKRYIDYSNSIYQSDFLDIFLSSKCKFFVSSDSGISAIPEVFKVPVVNVNITSLNHMHRWSHKRIFIFKKYYSLKEDRYLKFDEVLKLKIGARNNNEYLEEMKIEVHDNTDEEIMRASIEMDDLIDGRLSYSYHDNKIQRLFWNIFKPNDLRPNFYRIGKDYIRNNKSLL